MAQASVSTSVRGMPYGYYPPVMNLTPDMSNIHNSMSGYPTIDQVNQQIAALQKHSSAPMFALPVQSPIFPYPSNMMSHYANLQQQYQPSKYLQQSMMPITSGSNVPVGAPGNEQITLHPPSPDKPRVFYRNLFHTIHGKFLHDGSNWEGCRVYIHDSVGYSGNAKRFKRRPEKGEKALILECNILDPKEQTLSQTCLACRDYFETQKYFKTNQECIGKMMLVKNNSPISVENGQFKILVKMMCCCIHHAVEYFVFELNLTSTITNRKLYTAKVPLNVKQWRKSNQKKRNACFFWNSSTCK